MFESRMQLAQATLFLAGILAGIGILVLIYGPLPVGIFCIVVSHAVAALGNGWYAEAKGYPARLGIPLGAIFGVAGVVIPAMLPDLLHPSPFQKDAPPTGEGVRNARNRDKGYEVLEDD